MADITWCQTPGARRLHAWKPHPLNRDYVWTACGMLYGAKVIGELKAIAGAKKCMRCVSKASKGNPVDG